MVVCCNEWYKVPFLVEERRKIVDKYSLLKGMSVIARLAGWIGLLGAVILAFAGGSKVGNGYGAESFAGMVMLGGAAIIFTLCTFIVLLGEVVQVFIDTESNTDRAARFLERIAGSDALLRRSELRVPERAVSR
jgi:hypothetical protein